MSEFDNDENKSDPDFIYPKRNATSPEYIETQIIPNDRVEDSGKIEHERGKRKDNGTRPLIMCVVILLFVLFAVIGAFTMYVKNENFRNLFSGKTEQLIATDTPTVNKNAPTIELYKPSDSEGRYTNESVNNIVSPSVVAIITYDSDNDMVAAPISQGSGIIISEDGYVVTNSHVVEDSKKYDVRVILTSENENEIPAKVVGLDIKTDIAVLKMDRNGLTPAKFANSDDIKVASKVLAFGTPLGTILSPLVPSVSQGIVSAVNRTVGDDNNKYIQTDAAINAGNSGGPLVNMFGQVIGMNRFKIIVKNCENVSFAIPSNVIKSIADDIMKNGYVTGRAKLGVRLRENVWMFGFISRGVVIDSVTDSEWAKVLAPGDIIVEVNGKIVYNSDVIYKGIDEMKPGDDITMKILKKSRTGYSEKTVTLKLLEDKGEGN